MNIFKAMASSGIGKATFPGNDGYVEIKLLSEKNAFFGNFFIKFVWNDNRQVHSCDLLRDDWIPYEVKKKQQKGKLKKYLNL